MLAKVGCNLVYLGDGCHVNLFGWPPRFGSLWVAFFGCQVWVLGIRLQAGWRSWIVPRVATICGWLGTCLGWLGTHVGCHWLPSGHFYFGHFLSFPLMGLYSPKVYATQAQPDFPRWRGFCTERKYCSIRNHEVGGNNICLNLHAEALFVTRFASYLWV